ncbi:MAG TPA: fasciclin domain-containing protein [Blastocatellia bacterium]
MKSVYQIAASLGALATWVAAVEVVGLVDLLKGDDYITVFAPNDEAFSKMSRNSVEEMLDDFDKFAANIRYHIAPGRVTSGELGQITSLRTMLKDDLLIDARRGLHVNNARIVEPDIDCRNGVIHIIDSVLTIRKHSKVRAGQFAMDLGMEHEYLSRPDLTMI